ncbi:hypothetical protein [Cohnella candidum]|uniref:Uncharacterized protein n=1 Tax=Cohnella candidum TaxID=2674991 RepID=A0A3G3K4Q5_9BACL|nr:hypothetical protein [Cohnella candidum]AYQ75151.1 hypothetical protein EAV92_22935 [Cohnella candidum]
MEDFFGFFKYITYIGCIAVFAGIDYFFISLEPDNWPWVIGGTLIILAIGYGINKLSHRIEEKERAKEMK